MAEVVITVPTEVRGADLKDKMLEIARKKLEEVQSMKRLPRYILDFVDALEVFAKVEA